MMRSSGSVMLYTAVAAIAIGAAGLYLARTGGVTTATQVAPLAVPDTAKLVALREGTMLKLIFSNAPKPVTEAVFTEENGAERRFADYNGRYVLVNFWATWCAPCRKEMPALDVLNQSFDADDFQVVTIATGRNTLPGIKGFFLDTGIETLPILLDPTSQVARDMGVLGLPVSVILNRQGQEIARLRGDAKWDSASAKAIISALVAGS